MRVARCAMLAAAAFSSGCERAVPAKFSAPAAALHEPVADVYLVSNARPDGAPGYLVAVSPEDGARRMWADGAAPDVELVRPAGMALVGDVLWVADGAALRRFDRRTGAQLASVPVDGAAHLVDVAAGPGGAVYACDAGLDAGGRATGTDAIWRVGENGVVTVLARGPELAQPTSLTARAAGVYVVGARDGSFYEVDYRGARTELARAPQPGLRGLVRVEPPAGSGAGARAVYFATSWDGAAVYRFGLTGSGAALPVRVEQPGRLGYDALRRRLIVPLVGASMLHVEAL